MNALLTGATGFVGTFTEIHRLTPGLTGWVQINGRDEFPMPVKVPFDEYYLRNRSMLLDMKIILLTFFKVARREEVKH